MRNALILFVATLAPVLGAASPAHAQNTLHNRDAVFLEQASWGDMQIETNVNRDMEFSALHGLVGGTNAAFQGYLSAIQTTNGNKILVLQDGDDNVATATQFGLSNLAALNQQGSRNRTSLEQVGAGNLFGARLLGDNNQLDVIQLGTDNSYVLDFVGSNLDFTGAHAVAQIGNHNSLVQIGEGTLPFSVQQRGSGMAMIIRHR